MTAGVKSFQRSLRFPLFFIGLIWVIHILKFIFDLPLNYFGVYPREIFGLKGVLTSPLIHGDFGHLISNSAPALVLLTMLFVFYRKVALKSFFLIYILTGLAVWMFANNRAFHIGASGVVYGLVSFVFWSGIFRRNIKSIVLALVVTVLYSGYFLGIVPNDPKISWESHLFGAIVGIFVAYVFRKQIEKEEEVERFSVDEEENSEFFFERDAFS